MSRSAHMGLRCGGRATVIFLAALFAAAGCAPARQTARPRNLSSLVLPGRRVAPPPKVEPPRAGPPKINGRHTWTQSPTVTSKTVPMGKVTRLTIHHEGMGIAEETSIEAIKDELRMIQKSHKAYRGWADIGYHYIIDYSGGIWQGRPIEYQGAHAGNNAANRGNIGVVLMGNFERQKPTARQLDALRGMVDFLMTEYDIPISQVHTHCEVSRHYSLGWTDCPGRFLQREVNIMRRRIAEVKTPDK